MLADAMDAPVDVKLVTVPVVTSATAALMDAADADVALSVVTAATARLADAADTMVALTLPVASSMTIDAVPSFALMLVTSRLVRSRVVVLTVVIVAAANTADAADTTVNVPAAGDEPPMVVASMVPPLMSAVVATTLLSVTTPVESAIEPAAVPSFALRFVSSRLVLSTVVALTVVILPVVAVAVVNVPAAGVPPPMVVPSMVPPLMSAVVTVPRLAQVPVMDTLLANVQPLLLNVSVSADASPTVTLPFREVAPATDNVPDTLRLVKLLDALMSWKRVPSYTTATISPAVMSPATNAVLPSRVTFLAPRLSMLSVTAPVFVAAATK